MADKRVNSSARTRQRYEYGGEEGETNTSVLKDKQTLFSRLSKDGPGESLHEKLEIADVQQSIKNIGRMRL